MATGKWVGWLFPCLRTQPSWQLWRTASRSAPKEPRWSEQLWRSSSQHSRLPMRKQTYYVIINDVETFCSSKLHYLVSWSEAFDIHFLGLCSQVGFVNYHSQDDPRVKVYCEKHRQAIVANESVQDKTLGVPGLGQVIVAASNLEALWKINNICLSEKEQT